MDFLIGLSVWGAADWLCPIASASPGMCLAGSAWRMGVASAALMVPSVGTPCTAVGVADGVAALGAAAAIPAVPLGIAESDGVMGTSRLLSFTSRVSPFFTGSVKSTGIPLTRMVK